MKFFNFYKLRKICISHGRVFVMSRDARKPVFVVSTKVRHKPACAVTEAG